MKRMITKKMRDSFNCNEAAVALDIRNWFAISLSEKTKKQRILILRRTIK